MKRTLTLVFALITAVTCAMFVTATSSAQGDDVLQRVAHRAVVDVLKVQPGEAVLISTWRHTLDLAEELARECYRAGAHPLITVDSDKLYAFRLSDVPEEVLRETSKLDMGLTQSMDVEITLAGPEDPAVFSAGSPAKLIAVNAAGEPVMQLWQERKLRGLYISHGFATPQRAAQYGVDYKAWSGSVLGALAADLESVRPQAEKLEELLSDAEEIVIMTPGGTDLVLSTQGRKFGFDDGMLKEEDIAAGRGWAMAPSGSVWGTTVETSADGRVVVPSVALWGTVVENLVWIFEDGQLVEYDADANLDSFAQYYESASGDKGRIAALTIGVNPGGIPTGVGLDDWLCSGVVSIGIGHNLEQDGQNDSDFSWSVTLTDATVIVDGVTVVDFGEIAV